MVSKLINDISKHHKIVITYNTFSEMYLDTFLNLLKNYIGVKNYTLFNKIDTFLMDLGNTNPNNHYNILHCGDYLSNDDNKTIIKKVKSHRYIILYRRYTTIVYKIPFSFSDNSMSPLLYDSDLIVNFEESSFHISKDRQYSHDIEQNKKYELPELELEERRFKIKKIINKLNHV